MSTLQNSGLIVVKCIVVVYCAQLTEESRERYCDEADLLEKVRLVLFAVIMFTRVYTSFSTQLWWQTHTATNIKLKRCRSNCNSC